MWKAWRSANCFAGSDKNDEDPRGTANHSLIGTPSTTTSPTQHPGHALMTLKPTCPIQGFCFLPPAGPIPMMCEWTISTRGHGAMAARLTPDEKVGSSNLSALIFRDTSRLPVYVWFRLLPQESTA